MLGTFDDLFGQVVAKGAAQQEFGRFTAVDFPLGGQAKAQRDRFYVQERDARFEAERHGDAVGALQVGVVQRGGDAEHFILEPLRVVIRTQVIVSGVDFIGTFAGEDDFDVLRGHFCQEKVGDGGTDQGRVEGFEVVDDLGERLQRFFFGINPLVVLSAQGFRHFARSGDVFAAFHPNGKRVQMVSARVGQHGDDAAVKTAAQADSDGHIAEQTLLHGVTQRGADGFDGLRLVLDLDRERIEFVISAPALF